MIIIQTVIILATIHLVRLHEYSCQHYNLVRYRVTFQADWSEEKFPKQYPTVRPPAQWSKLIGRTHTDDYKLWSAGVLAKSAFKKFAQEGASDLLEKIETQGFDGIFDMFSAPPLQKGVGEMSSDFFASNDHPLVSVAVRIVPSPDWFVGIDSVTLCPNGTWLSDLSIPLNPVDAGTDRGYTFTSPKWASRPQETIYHITSQYPNHRANSFYYPDVKELPNMGYMKFELLMDYKTHRVHREVRHHRELGEVAQLEEDLEKKREEVEEQQILHGEPILPIDNLKSSKPKTKPSNFLEPMLPRDQQSKTAKSSERVDQTIKHKKNIKPYVTPPSTQSPKKTYENLKPIQRSSKNSNIVQSKTKTIKKVPDNGRRGVASIPDCLVGDWGLWTECSKTCGFGVQKRYRKVAQIPVQGRPCPALEQEKWCGGMRNCREQMGLFSWLDNDGKKAAQQG